MAWFKDKFSNLADSLQDRYDHLRGNDIEEPQNQTLLQQIDEATTLTRTQRAIGFLTCLGMGLLLSMIAPMYLLRPIKLATTLTLGNVLSLGSTMFLTGPSRQCGMMCDEKRRISAGIYLVSLLLTLLAAFYVHSRLLCLVFIAIQYAALAWYSISYIPGGQAFVMRMLGRVDTGEF